MGNYLYLGIRTRATADIRKLKRYDGAVSAFIEELNKTFDQSIYDIKVNEDDISIALKEEYSKPDVMREFLLEQFSKIVLNDEWLLENVEKLKSANTEEDIISALDTNKDITNVYVYLKNISFKPTAEYKVETLAFLHAGKFYLEEYNELSRYIINILRSSSNNKLIKSLGFYEC